VVPERSCDAGRTCADGACREIDGGAAAIGREKPRVVPGEAGSFDIQADDSRFSY
jgi:hypothetical protein